MSLSEYKNLRKRIITIMICSKIKLIKYLWWIICDFINFKVMKPERILLFKNIHKEENIKLDKFDIYFITNPKNGILNNEITSYIVKNDIFLNYFKTDNIDDINIFNPGFVKFLNYVCTLHISYLEVLINRLRIKRSYFITKYFYSSHSKYYNEFSILIEKIHKININKNLIDFMRTEFLELVILCDIKILDISFDIFKEYINIEFYGSLSFKKEKIIEFIMNYPPMKSINEKFKASINKNSYLKRKFQKYLIN